MRTGTKSISAVSRRLASFVAAVTLSAACGTAVLSHAAGEQQTVDEAKALGRAQATRQGTALKDGSAATAVSTTVPGYTSNPPQATYYNSRDLVAPVQEQRANCAANPNSPTCAGIATATAGRPQQNVSNADPALMGAVVGRRPELIFGDIASTYNACSVGGHPVSPDGHASVSCSLDTGAWSTHACTKSLFVETRLRNSCEPPGSNVQEVKIVRGGNEDNTILVQVQCWPFIGNTIRFGFDARGPLGSCSGPMAFADVDMSVPQTMGPHTIVGWVSPVWDSTCRPMTVFWEGQGCVNKQCSFNVHFAANLQFTPTFGEGGSVTYTMTATEHHVASLSFTQPHLMSVPGDTLLNQCAAYEAVTSDLPPDGVNSSERPVLPTVRALDAMQCVRTESVCVVGAGTRIIDGVPVTKECWRYANQFDCTTLVTPSTCVHPAYRNCQAVGRAACLRQDGAGHCLQANAQLTCNAGGAAFTPAINCGEQSYCAGGSCYDTTYAANTDFAMAVSQMEARAEAGDTFDEKTLTVFNGTDNRCSRDHYGFSDCCGGSSVTQCSEAEKRTVKQREDGKCARAGDYCSRKNLFGCYETTETYCCFGSLLARLVQEQGRAQLGRGWGGGKSPDCSGLTVDELTAIDWSKLDFTEFYATIKPTEPNNGDSTAAAGDKQQSCYWGNGRC